MLNEYADEIQTNLDERNNLIAEFLKDIYECLQDFTSELDNTMKDKQEHLNTRLGSLFKEIETLERNIRDVEGFLHKVSSEISKFIEVGNGAPENR